MSVTSHPKLKYRADIDGLRAVAVLLVVLCHLKIRWFAGGYVGVDVFFVISGYLISAIIFSEITSSSFSIVGFYERRIRRILPALLAMMFATCVLCYIYLLPTELEDFAKSLLAATFSFSNIYFWRQAGYFDAPSAFKPLLHTWSLGVEEQFYIFFPVILVLTRRFFPRRMRTAIVLIAAVSFVWSAIGAFTSPTGTFFLLHTRAWELLVGTIIALRILPDLPTKIAREVAAASGLLLILFANFAFHDTTPFPGIAALAPCLGAGLIIAAGQPSSDGRPGGSTVGSLLSLKPVVFVGLISYSLYLWHWPVIVFQGVAGIFGGNDVMRTTPKIYAFVISMVLGYLSWRWVEVPFRGGKLKLAGASLFRVATAGVGAVTLIAVVALLTHGFSGRFSPEAVRIGSYLQYEGPYREGSCFITSKEAYSDFKPSVCLDRSSEKKNYLLIGDSHAAHLWPGLSSVFKGVNIMQATASGCLPVLDPHGDPRCTQLINFIYTNYLPSHPVDKLLIAGHWTEKDLPELEKTLAWANQRGIPVVLFGPIVEYDTALPRLLILALNKKDANLPFHHLVLADEQLDERMRQMTRSEPNTEYISYYGTLCSSESCIDYAEDGEPLQFDTTHLTRAGSILVAEKLSKNSLLP